MVTTLIALSLVQGFGQGQPPSPELDPLTAAKQISIALMIYCADHNEIFPKKGDWKKELMPYVKSAAVFNPPGVKADPYSVFEINANLMGKAQTMIKDPSKTVMVYLGKKGKLSFTYDGKSVVGFADGSAKLITPKEAKKLIWKL